MDSESPLVNLEPSYAFASVSVSIDDARKIRLAAVPVFLPAEGIHKEQIAVTDAMERCISSFSSQITSIPKRVNVDVLKQRLIEEKKKEKVKRTIILSSVVVSLGALTLLTY